MAKNNNRITIVTVCRNAEKEIQTTVESVFGQKNVDFEYLIIDGASNDATLKIIDEQIQNSNCTQNVKVISESDNGIYSAMNKGINMATGEWVIFLNAGDSFYNNRVLEKMKFYLEGDEDFIYGNSHYIEANCDYIVNGSRIDLISKKMPFCHQAVFNRRTTLKELRYDEHYKICADYDMYVRAYKQGYKFKLIDFVVCNYEVGGYSKKNYLKMLEENSDIKQKNQFIRYKKPYVLKQIARVYIGNFVSAFMPREIVGMIKRRKFVGDKNNG